MKPSDIKKLESFLPVYLRMCKDCKENNDQATYAYHRRSLQNHLTTTLCNTKAYWTGNITEAALASGARTKEHVYGMSRLAEDILALENPTIEAIRSEILSEKSKWNYTTSKENNILKHNGQNYDDPLISALVEYVK